jgi:hypothetical protein
MTMHNKSVHAIFIFGLFVTLTAANCLYAATISQWLNQTIYVPLYSHIYADERYKNKPFALTATLSIRNTDVQSGFILDKVEYYDSEGKKLRSYLKGPMSVKPLASKRFIVRESDKGGGSGAKFLVHWHAEKPVSEPIVESIMIGTQLQQGISFISPGRVIDGTISK